MEPATTTRKPGKKILVIGELGYHEHTVVRPILEQLKQLGATIDRSPGSMDFFVKENFPTMIRNWTRAPLGTDLSFYDVVFFVDYWNMAFPLFQYKKMIENPSIKFVGLCHGTVRLRHDVATLVPTAEDYEEYLKASFDTILVHAQWLRELIRRPFVYNLHVAGLPVDLHASRIRPTLLPNNRVIYAHRFEPDKGCQMFLEFVANCRMSEDPYINGTRFFATTNDQEDFRELEIAPTGWLTQEELKELCSPGGYAWSSVNSETVGYTVSDLCSYGLTPLLNHHKAYNPYPNKFKYTNFEEAKKIIKDKVTMSNTEWDKMLEPMLSNSRRIAEVINGSIS